MSRIGPTAHYTAYVWHRLGLPHAELFATPNGRRLFWTFRAAGEWLAAAHPTLPSMEQYLELRHRAIDHALTEHAPDRVIELGAGLSRRGITWAVDHDVDYLEIDLPAMVEAKRNLIRERAPSAIREHAAKRLRHAAIDVLGADLVEQLSTELAGSKRPAVIAEGLLGYFDYADRLSVVRGVARALAGSDGVFLCDLRAREGGKTVALAAKALRGAIWLVTRGHGARADFASHADIFRFFSAAGFEHAEPIAVERATPHLSRLRSPARVWRARPGPAPRGI